MPRVTQLESRSLDFQPSWNSFSGYLSQLNALLLCVGRPGNSPECGACPYPHRPPLILLLISEMSRVKGPQRGVRCQEGARLEAGQLLRAACRGRCGTDLAGPWALAAGAELAPWREDGGRAEGGRREDRGDGGQPACGAQGGAREGGSLPCAKLWLVPQWTPTRLPVALIL